MTFDIVTIWLTFWQSYWQFDYLTDILTLSDRSHKILIDPVGSCQIWGDLNRSGDILTDLGRSLQIWAWWIWRCWHLRFLTFYLLTFDVVDIWHCWHLTFLSFDILHISKTLVIWKNECVSYIMNNMDLRDASASKNNVHVWLKTLFTKR